MGTLVINEDTKGALRHISEVPTTVLTWPSADEVAKAMQEDAGITLTWVTGYEFDGVTVDKENQIDVHMRVETEVVVLVEIYDFWVINDEGSYIFHGCIYDEVLEEDESISYSRREYKLYIESPQPHYHEVDF